MSIIKAGTILTLEHGEYSDWSYEGPFRVVHDFDQQMAADAFKAANKSTWSWDFAEWLSREGYVEDVPDGFRWYLGSYGFNPEIG